MQAVRRAHTSLLSHLYLVCICEVVQWNSFQIISVLRTGYNLGLSEPCEARNLLNDLTFKCLTTNWLQKSLFFSLHEPNCPSALMYQSQIFSCSLTALDVSSVSTYETTFNWQCDELLVSWISGFKQGNPAAEKHCSFFD